MKYAEEVNLISVAPGTGLKPLRTRTRVLVLRFFLHLVLAGYAWCAAASAVFAVEEGKLIQLKAAFIYSFIEYVRWPEATSEDDVIKIGILGEDSLVKPLRQIAERRKVEGKRLVVEVFPDGNAIEPCKILFIPGNRVAELDSLREGLEASNVLLIGDTDGLAKKGVAINFVVARERLRFEISRNALKRANLKVGAKMLNLAILVDQKEGK
jgi:hypothetical protein